MLSLSLGLGLTSARGGGAAPEPPWSPLDLFASAQPGYWPDGYDPAGGTIFRENTGITAGAVGQVVGLVLDRSSWGGGGLAQFPNELDPFTFVGMTAVGGGNSPTANSFSTSRAGGYRGSCLQIGKQYYIEIDIVATGAGFGLFNTAGVLSGVGILGGTGLPSGSYRGFFTAENANLYFRLNGAGSLTVNSISLQEVPGHHAAQATALSRPTLTLADGRYHLYDDGGGSLSIALPSGTYGLAYIDAAGAITVTTITGPTDTLYAERQVDVILRQGAFSLAEDALIRDYWTRLYPGEPAPLFHGFMDGSDNIYTDENGAVYVGLGE